MPPFRSTAHVPTLSLTLAVVLTACGGDTSGPSPGIDAETFIATYVDLRSTALSAGESLISDAKRAQAINRHGVSEDDLTQFIEAHGEDVELMRDIWDEIERRLDVQRMAPDTGGATSSR